MTQKEIAKGINLDSSYLSKVETGKHKPSLQAIERIGVVTGVPLAVIFWEALEEEDVIPDKQDKFNSIKPAVDALLDQLF